MDAFQLLMQGFAIALQPTNLLFCLLGCVVGTLVGVLPGLGSGAAMAVLIPITFALDPTPAIIMLAAIYYGTMFGGTITSVLLNTPGEAPSAITALEGYAMAKVGRGGVALAVAAIGSFLGGTAAMCGLVLAAGPLTDMALRFGPPEFFALMAVGLSLVTLLASRSMIRALVSAATGLLVAQVGIDPALGVPRFTFGQMELLGGVDFVPVLMGLFGVSEVLANVEVGARRIVASSMGTLIPSLKDWRDSAWPTARGALIGFFTGLIPGVGPIIPTFVSYTVEKRVSKTPDRFGSGMIEGVAGPETANNANVAASMIPLFTLGLPGSPSVAILMGALMMNGLTPGPLLFKEHADFVWAVIASLFVGNVVLLVLNLPLIPLWIRLMNVPYSILFTLILVFTIVGAYTIQGTMFGVGVLLTFGVIGYVWKKLDIPAAPAALTLILGPMMERGLRRSLEMSGGDFSIFVTRPISATLLALTALLILSSVYSGLSRLRGEEAEVAQTVHG